MAGIWDCHFHIFHDPLCDERSGIILNATQRGTVTDLLRVFASYGISHGVAVSAMPYGTDNRVMVSALRQSRALRGIAVVDPLISEVEFAALEDAGVIGVRVNLMTEGLRQLTEPGVDRLFAMMRSVGWFLQLHSAADDLVPAVEILKRARVRLMFDHFGRPHPAWDSARRASRQCSSSAGRPLRWSSSLAPTGPPSRARPTEMSIPTSRLLYPRSVWIGACGAPTGRSRRRPGSTTRSSSTASAGGCLTPTIAVRSWR